MINLHQLFRAFSRVSAPQDSCYSTASSATRNPSPFVADAAAIFPTAPAPLPAASLATGVSASSAPCAAGTGAPAAGTAASPLPVPAPDYSLPVAAALVEVAAASCSPPSAVERQGRGTEATKKKRGGTWQQENCCSKNLPCFSSDTASGPDIVSSRPVSPPCSTASAGMAAVAAAAGAETESHEYLDVGGVFAGCDSSGSPSDISKAEETGVRETQQQEECCSTGDPMTGTTTGAMLKCFSGSIYDSTGAPAAAALSLSSGELPGPLPAAGSQPASLATTVSSTGVTVAVPFTSQASVASPSTLIGLIGRFDGSSATSASGHLARSSATKNEISGERSSLGVEEISGSRSTSCSRSTSSSNSPTTSSSNSPTTSCLGAALDSSCTAGRDSHSFSLSFASAAAGPAAATADEEVMRPPLPQRQQQTAASAREPVGIDHQQQTAAAEKKEASHVFQSTTATFLHLKPRQEELHASAALAAALAAVEAAKLQRAVESEKTRQQQQQGARCVYGEDSSGDSTAEASPACADFSSLLKKHGSRSSDEEELLVKSPGSCFSPATAAPAPLPPATGAGATAGAPAPPSASSSPEGASAWKAGVADASHTTAVAGGAGIAAFAPGPISTGNGDKITAAASVTATATTCNDFAAAAAAPGETLFPSQQCPPSGTAFRTLSEIAAHAQAAPRSSAAGGEAGDCAICGGLDCESSESTSSSGSSRTGSYSGVSSCSSADEKLANTPHQQQTQGAAAGKTDAGLLAHPPKAVEREPLEVAADAAAGTVTAVTTATAAGKEEASNSVDSARKEKECTPARDAEHGTAAAERSVIENKKTRHESSPCRKLQDGHAAAVAAAAAAVVTAVRSGGAATVSSVPAGACVGSPAASKESGVDNSNCFEKRESSSSNSCSVTATADRSRSNTSTSSDDCGGTDRCFSASLSADAGSLHPLSAAATRVGQGEEGAFTNMQPQQQQVAEESARLLSTAFPAAATDACSIAEKLKLLSPLAHGGSTAQGFPLGLDQTASAVFPSAGADASAAAAVATWFSSLLPHQQQQLCAAASAAFLPGLLLQPNIPCSSPNPPLTSTVSASGAPATCPPSEKLSTVFVASAAAKGKLACSAPAARTTESLCAFRPERRNSAAPVRALGDAPSETADAAAGAAQPAAANNAAEAAATRKQSNPEVSVTQEETALTAPALQKQQLSTLESQQQQQPSCATKQQQQHQVTSPTDQHISSVLQQQLQAPHGSAAAGSRAAHVAGVNGSSACLFTIESGGKFLPAAAGVSPASFASAPSCSSSSSCAPQATSPSPLPPTAVACILPGEVLSSSLLLSSAAAAPFHSPLSLLSSLPSAAPASSRSPVVAAVTRSLDAAACNTLFALPAPGVPTAANTGLLIPASPATVAARGLHADGVATELPATPVLAAAAGAMLPAVSGTSSCMASPSTAATPTLSSFHPLSSFRSAAATSPMRLEQLGTTPATAGQQQLQQSGKDSLLAAGSSPYSSLSSSAAPLSSFPSSSASPPFANLAAPASQVGPRGSRLLPTLAAKATQSLLESDANCTSTAALINKKHSRYEGNSSQRTEPSSTPAAGNAISLSAAPVSTTTATACTPASAAATLATTAAAVSSSTGEKQSVLPAAPPFSPSTVSASAFSTPSPTPLGGPVASLPCGSHSTSSQPTTPLLSQGTSADASAAGAVVAAPALQLQQPDPLQRSSNGARGVDSTSVRGAAEIPSGTSQPVTGAAEIPTGASQPVSGAAGTSLAAAVASPASTSALDTALSASPYGGVVDSDFWGTTAQQLLLQLNMQQLRHHGQQQHAQIALDSTHFSPSTFLPPLCISPLAAAAAVVADSSARPFSLARVHQQQVGTAAAARTAALVQEATKPGSAAVGLREAGATTATAANTSAAAHSSDLSGLIAVAAAMKKVNSTPLPPFTPLQASADTCQRQLQQPQNCGSAEAEGGEGKCVGSGNKATRQAGESKNKNSSFNQLKWAREQHLQQTDKQPTVKIQQQMQMQCTKQQTTAGEGGRISGLDGPPVKRARRGGGATASTVDSVALGFPNSSNNDCQLGTPTTTTAPARLPPLLKNSVDAAALKRVGATAVAGKGPGLVFTPPATATSLTGMQQQLLAQLQQNQLLLQSGATNGEKSLFDSRLARECAPLSEPAGVAAPAATATAACAGTSVAMQQGFRYFVESLSSPSVGALATTGATTGETGVTALTAGTSSGPILSALAASRLNGAPVAATSFASRLPSPVLLPTPDTREKISNAKDSAAAAAALHFQTLQQLHRLGLQPQQQQQETVSAACTLSAVGCPAGVTAANLRGKSSFPVSLTLPQQQRLSLSCSSSVTRATIAAAGGKVLPNEGPTTTAVSCNSETGAAAAGKEGRTTDTISAAGGTGLRGGPRQQKRTPRQDQQQRQQQRQATSLHRQEQNVSLPGMHQHHPGVCYSPPKDVWRARITVEGRQHEQQFSVKRHGFEEARLLAVQWRSQMERLRLGGADGGGGIGAPEGSGIEAAPVVAGSGAKAKSAAGMSKAGNGTGNSLINSSSSSSSGSTTLPVSSGSSSGGSNVVQYLGCSSSPGKTGLACGASGQQDIAKSVAVSAAQQPQQQDFVTPLTTCCSEPTYRDFTSISQLTGLCSNGCRPISSPSTMAADTSVSLLSGDPLSQMRTLALSARHLMHAKSLCATQQQSTGAAAQDSNSGACSAAILFPPSLLSLLDAAAGGGGRAAAASSVGGPLGIVAPSVPPGDTAPPKPYAAVPALSARSRPAAAAARGCS